MMLSLLNREGSRYQQEPNTPEIANRELRWAGMSQELAQALYPYGVDTPGAHRERYSAPPWGSYNPHGPTDSLTPLRPFQFRYVPPPRGEGNGMPGGVSNPLPSYQGSDCYQYGAQILHKLSPERGYNGNDTLSGSRAVPTTGGTPALIYERIGQPMPRQSTVMFQQGGVMPPTMASVSAGILRNGVLVTAGTAILPGEVITLFAQLSGFIGGDTVRFTITDATLERNIVFGPVEQRKGLFSNRVELETVGPSTPGQYVLEAVEIRPFFPDTSNNFSFKVAADAPPPPQPRPGTGGRTGFLSSLLPLLIIVGIIALSPSINTVTDRFAR